MDTKQLAHEIVVLILNREAAWSGQGRAPSSFLAGGVETLLNERLGHQKVEALAMDLMNALNHLGIEQTELEEGLAACVGTFLVTVQHEAGAKG